MIFIKPATGLLLKILALGHLSDLVHKRSDISIFYQTNANAKKKLYIRLFPDNCKWYIYFFIHINITQLNSSYFKVIFWIFSKIKLLTLWYNQQEWTFQRINLYYAINKGKIMFIFFRKRIILKILKWLQVWT